MPSPKKLTLAQYDDSLSQDFTLQNAKKSAFNHGAEGDQGGKA